MFDTINLYVTASVKGDKESVYLLWRELEPMWRKWSYTTHLQGYDREDLIQESYILLLQCLDNFDATLKVPFLAYYYKQLYYWRSNQYHKKTHVLLEEEEILEQIPDEKVDIPLQVERLLLYEELCSQMNRLKDWEKKLLLAYYIEGKKMEVLAVEYGHPYKTLKTYKERALRKLKNLSKNSL